MNLEAQQKKGDIMSENRIKGRILEIEKGTDQLK